MIKLFGFGKNLGLIDASPFVTKVHAFLRFNQLEYKTISNPKNIGLSPKSKLPFIEDGDKVVCDSQLIIEYLTHQYKLDIDVHLSEKDKASGYLIGKSLDENLYWCLVWSRWQDEKTWPTVKKAFFKGLPFPLSALLPKILRKKTIKALHAQGTGRHSEVEVIEIANHSFKALSNLLGEQKYFFGDKISSFDATAYAFISSFTQADLENAINSIAKDYDNLVAYAERINQEYFD
jgi:glutathione S-transferase